MLKVNSKQLTALGGETATGKKRKYRNYHTYGKAVDGVSEVVYHSKKEAERAGELRILSDGGAIKNLRQQVPFKLIVNGQLICKYVADFTYNGVTGAFIVEDVKSDFTRKERTYVLKKKLMKAIHSIEIHEI